MFQWLTSIIFMGRLQFGYINRKTAILSRDIPGNDLLKKLYLWFDLLENLCMCRWQFASLIRKTLPLFGKRSRTDCNQIYCWIYLKVGTVGTIDRKTLLPFGKKTEVRFILVHRNLFASISGKTLFPSGKRIKDWLKAC